MDPSSPPLSPIFPIRRCRQNQNNVASRQSRCVSDYIITPNGKKSLSNILPPATSIDNNPGVLAYLLG